MEIVAPKLFISYSWSTPEHEQWVLDLATELVESGVDVKLDKWDLREGHDSVAFMEQMVTDSTIKKVLIVSDRVYAEKADGRNGGVGVETQIISRKIYENQSQDKFVAILPCRDENGKAYLPTYYNSRIYIDLSDADRYSGEFEKLLRWIFDKPLFVKPDIGKRPSFLESNDSVSLGTATSFKRASDAIRNGKSHADGALDEYLTVFTENLERFRIESSSSIEFDDKVVENISELNEAKNELLGLVLIASQYHMSEGSIHRIHRFFERLIDYTDAPRTVGSYRSVDFDNYRFLLHEIFLGVIAILCKHEKFLEINLLLETPYYSSNRSHRYGGAVGTFRIFLNSIESLDYRNKRLGLGKASLRAEMIKDRSKHSCIDFTSIMQADFILYLRAEFQKDGWWPITLVYAGHQYSPFELFARSSSKKYFDRMKVILSVSDKRDIDAFIDDVDKGGRRIPSSGWDRFSPKNLMGYDDLCTRP